MQAVYVAPRGGRRPNLWACQVRDVIFFYGTDPIPACTELVVAYCRRYSSRLRQALALAAGKLILCLFLNPNLKLFCLIRLLLDTDPTYCQRLCRYDRMAL